MPRREASPAARVEGHETPEKAYTPSAVAILDAAEELFCARGFAGASMREIAAASNQPLASANYYFGSKTGLFEAAFLRRIVPVNRRRIELLKDYRANGRLALADVVDAYLRPLFEQNENAPEPGESARLIMLFSKQLLSSPEEHEYLQAYYDEVSREFIRGIREAMPSGSATEAAWGYNYMIGILVFTLAGKAMTARVPDEILRGIGDEPSAGDAMLRLKTFICAGLDAVGGAPRQPLGR